MDKQKVKRVEFDRNGVCRTYSGSDQLVCEFETVYERVFNSQYGVPLSLDGDLLFVGTWRRGLFCYETSTGHLVWRKGPGKVRRIVASEAYVIVEMCDRGICKRAIRTGEPVAQVKMTAIECMLPIEQDEVFAGPKRNDYFIFTVPDLIRRWCISIPLLNPNDCLSFTIRTAEKAGSSLIVRGFEEYPNRDYGRKGVRTFEREIDLEDCKEDTWR